MEKGEVVYTRRFLHVKIGDIYDSRADAFEAGYTVDAHYDREPGYGVAGKISDPIAHPNRMTFAAYRTD